MAELVEVVEELGKVRLAPLVIPVLKVIDPVMESLPRGSLQAIISAKKKRERLVKTVEGAAPVLTDMIRLAGHLAESRLATGLLSFTATLSAPFVKLSAPLLSRLVVPLSGPALRLASSSGFVLSPSVKLLDALVKAELFFEKPFKRESAS